MGNEKFIHNLILTAIVAAVYAALTVALPLQYGAVQFRVAEILTLLCFYNKRFIPALILGCFIANLPSELGWIDWVCGTAATAIAVVFMPRIKNIWLAATLPVITNAVIVGAMLTYLFKMPFVISSAFVGLGQFTVIMVIGVPLFKFVLSKNRNIMQLIQRG
ncbi:MAG: QueT transporter family protein [Oscillospiraceae bacterium]|nr:QueT transporter family protein [Oscillospiraceae bacterium]